MQDKSLIIFYVTLFFLLAAALQAQENMALHLKIMDREQAGAPERAGDYIIFSYKGSNYTRYVAARFAHENFEILHVYQLNQHDVFVLVYPVPFNISRLQYRIVVDGIMSTDPHNPRTETDLSGIAFSIFEIQPVREKQIINPQINGNEAIFTLKNSSGRAIYLAGDFNDWDPYMYRLMEIKPGLYQITLTLSQGIHYYYYLIDNTPYPDPNNPHRGIDSYKRDISIFVIK